MQGVESSLHFLSNYTSSHWHYLNAFMYKVGQLFMNDCGWETHACFVVSASQTFSFIPITIKVFTKKNRTNWAPQGKGEPGIDIWLSN